MDDAAIIGLFFARDERALRECERKYGRVCRAAAKKILRSPEDCEEAVNDTWAGAWNAIPPQKPQVLSAFLCGITRNLALKRLRENSAAKRGAGETPAALEELEECISAGQTPEQAVDAAMLAERISDFLAALPAAERRVFLCRYWYFDSVASIALRFGCTQSRVKMMLKRTRDALALQLEKEGYSL